MGLKPTYFISHSLSELSLRLTWDFFYMDQTRDLQLLDVFFFKDSNLSYQLVHNNQLLLIILLY